MNRDLHEGILYRDSNRRYCVCKLSDLELQVFTCTSGCFLEVWLDHLWIAGHIEGDGEDYWLFANEGGKFLLAEQMKARCRERW